MKIEGHLISRIAVRRCRLSGRHRGFTLLEVLLTIGVLLLILAIALPDYEAMFGQRSLKESGDQLKALIVMAHARSMKEGRRYRVFFPGTPDPNDDLAEKEIDVPLETLQPKVERQVDPLINPEWYEEVNESWIPEKIMMDGTRCVAVLPGKPNFDINPETPIAGPSVSEDLAEFVRVTFHPDGTSDWATFVLTDLPFEIEVEEDHVGRIMNVVVDGRTGKPWMQRALRVTEVELMLENGAEPILRQDFTDPMEITEDHILHVQLGQDGAQVGRRAE